MQNWPKNLIRGQVYLYQREKLDQQRLVLPEIRKTRDTYVIMTSLLCFRLDYLLTKYCRVRCIHFYQIWIWLIAYKMLCFQLSVECVVLSKMFFIFKAPLPQFPSKVTLDRDCYVAHKMAAISCLMERYIAMCIIQQEIMLQSENYLR